MFLPILFGSRMWRHKQSYGMLNSLCHNDFIWNIPYIFHKKKIYPKYCIMFGKKRLRKNCGFCGFSPTYNGERKWFILLVNFVWHRQIIDPHKVCNFIDQIFAGWDLFPSAVDGMKKCSADTQDLLVWLYMCRGLGPFGPNLVRRYAGARFGTHASGTMLNEQESKLFSGVFFLCFMHVLENLTSNLGKMFFG